MLCEALAKLSGLTSLDLSWNYIGVDGCKALSEALAEHSGLTSLNISSNGIHFDDCEALSKMLPTHRHLISLNISNNTSGTDGCKAVGEALAEHYSLRDFNVHELFIDTDELHLLYHCVENWSLNDCFATPRPRSQGFVTALESIKKDEESSMIADSFTQVSSVLREQNQLFGCPGYRRVFLIDRRTD